MQNREALVCRIIYNWNRAQSILEESRYIQISLSLFRIDVTTLRSLSQNIRTQLRTLYRIVYLIYLRLLVSELKTVDTNSFSFSLFSILGTQSQGQCDITQSQSHDHISQNVSQMSYSLVVILELSDVSEVQYKEIIIIVSRSQKVNLVSFFFHFIFIFFSFIFYLFYFQNSGVRVRSDQSHQSHLMVWSQH